MGALFLALVFLAGCTSGTRGGGPLEGPVWPASGGTLARIVLRPAGSGASAGLEVAHIITGTSAVYDLQVTNIGRIPGRLRVKETARSTGWTARYYDSAEKGLEITRAVGVEGFYTPPLAPNESFRMRVEVLPPAGVEEAEGGVTVHAYADNSDSAAARVVVRPPAAPKPSVVLRRAGSEKWGDLVKVEMSDGDSATVEARVGNVGTATGPVGLSLLGNLENWRLAMKNARGADVTDDVLSGRWARTIKQGEAELLTLTITPRSAARGDRLRFLLTASAGTRHYRAGIEANMLGRYQPDIQISMDGDEWMSVGSATGGGQAVFSVDGADELRLRIKNSGDMPDRFVLTESGYDARWRAVYALDAKTPADVTDAVRGLGWRTPALKAGAFVDLVLRVTPGEGRSLPNLLLKLKAVSSRYNRKEDMQTLVFRLKPPKDGG